ncbi:MAG: YdcF family protein [Fimbriimonadaceae bacterium]|nr:YdcF family protein [Alphaproteobacteria bacterium]
MVAFLLGFALSALVGGFFWFVADIPNERALPRENADAIVALTGGATRIEDALGLLRDNRAERLLITGVHPGTSKDILADGLPEFAAQFACCVDIDHRAMNTVGNAVETARWANARGIGSLLVVTSNYHMPRSLLELARVIPDVSLSPYPVFPENVRIEAWWSHPGTLQLLISEYAKYLAALARKTVAG